MGNGELDRFIREYIERVVNQQDLSAVDEMVSSAFVGAGPDWPGTFQELREFYARQHRARPDWRIHIQETVAVGEWSAVRALAGGEKAYHEDGSPQSPPFVTSLEWLTIYRIVDRKILEIRLVSVVDHSPD